MLTLDQVSYEYDSERFKFDLTVHSGEILALMGASGAGKSTLLSLIAGFIQPKSGSIEVKGTSVLGLSPYQRPFSMLFQEHNLFAHLSVVENISLGLNPSLKLNVAQQQQVMDAAAQVGIGHLLERLPSELSGGQRQRIALARCFVQPNPIWLLDEPFSALDPILRVEMLALVKSLAKERDITVIMVSHHLNDIRAIADRFAFVAEHQVLEVGEIAALDRNHLNTQLADFVIAGE
ncbi:thiamine ABC transporter ATP-binding protein [Vibrio sp. WJH972]